VKLPSDISGQELLKILQRVGFIVILTIRELFEGKQPNIPLVDSASFKKAPRERQGNQDALPF
jgi:hypothetical protein